MQAHHTQACMHAHALICMCAKHTQASNHVSASSQLMCLAVQYKAQETLYEDMVQEQVCPPAPQYTACTEQVAGDPAIPPARVAHCVGLSML
jgi:hypothetical protein